MTDKVPAAEATVLTVDLGTGGPKVALVSLDGTVHWSEFRPIATDHPGPHRATQDAELWWEEILDAARGALATGMVDPASVVAVSVTGQWSSTVPVGNDFHPVGPCRLWMDTSAAHHSRSVVGGPALGYNPTKILPWIRRTAGIPSPFGGDPTSHILGFQRDEPQLTARTSWFMEPVDYLTARFAGRAVASAASMSGAWLIDVRGSRREYDPQLLKLSGIDRRQLPVLIESGSVVGPIRPEVAQALGVPETVQIVSGTPDIHSAHVGSGAVGLGQGHVSISTTSWISCAFDVKKTDPFHSIATIPGLQPGSYLVADNHEAAGASLAWLSTGVLGEDYDALCAQAATSAPGSNGAVFTPWLAGMRSPVDDRHARGSFQHLSLTTTRADLIHAVLEGVAVQSRWLLEPVEKFVGRRFESMRIIGGGARSDLWCQLHADAMNRPIERVADPMTAQSRGAALIAGLALGRITWDQIPSLVPVDATFTPRPQHRSLYDRLSAELPKTYAATKGLFAARARG